MIFLIDFAIEYRAVLFALDAFMCTVVALWAVYMMQVVAQVSDDRASIGMPWPRGLETLLRFLLAVGATAAFLVPAQYWAGRVHFVLVEEVVFHTALAVIGIVVVIFRRHLFSRRPTR